jgi:hypothetical protein
VAARSSALKTPALPRVAVAAGLAPGVTGPSATKAPLPPPPAAVGAAKAGKSEAVFEDEPTNFFDASSPSAPAGGDAGEDENTAFFDGAAHAKAAEAQFGAPTRLTPVGAAPPPSIGGPVPKRKSDPNVPPAAAQAKRKSDPNARPLAAQQIKPRPPTLDYEAEKTEFLQGDALSEMVLDDKAGEPAVPRTPTLRGVDAKGFEEEEATHIFFNKDDGTGIPELLAEEAAPAPAAPKPMKFPPTVRVSAEALQPVPAATPAQPAKPAPAPAAQPSAAQQIPAQPRTKTGERARSNTLQMRAAPQQRDRLSTVLLVLGVGMLLIAIAGLLIKTPLGVTLGLRKANIGAIEVRTTPAVDAAIKLDGVYRGRAPLRMDGVRAGARHLELEAEGYVKVARDIDLSAGTTAMVDIALVAKPGH